MFKWGKKFNGYEVSSRGDRRFSAFNAYLEDGRTIEHHYQCDVKGYDVGGKNWKLGKGKPPLDTSKNLWEEYLKLWRRWAKINPDLMEELRAVAKLYGYTLTDMFAKTEVNQAKALATILNEMYPDG